MSAVVVETAMFGGLARRSEQNCESLFD